MTTVTTSARRWLLSLNDPHFRRLAHCSLILRVSTLRPDSRSQFPVPSPNFPSPSVQSLEPSTPRFPRIPAPLPTCRLPLPRIYAMTGFPHYGMSVDSTDECEPWDNHRTRVTTYAASCGLSATRSVSGAWTLPMFQPQSETQDPRAALHGRADRVMGGVTALSRPGALWGPGAHAQTVRV